jgi:hypothetical protein
MRSVALGVLITASLLLVRSAYAWDGCGVGCHASMSGACIVDGWGRVRNECPAGNHPRPPCPRDTKFWHGACQPY